MDLPDFVKKSMLTDKEFNELLKDQMDGHFKYFEDEERDGFVPMLDLVVVDNNGGPDFKRQHVLIILNSWDEDKKHETLRAIGKTMALELSDKTVTTVYMATEAWMRQGAIPSDKQVHDYDDKIEAIITVGMTMDKRANMGVQKITRGDNKEISISNEQILYYDPDPKGKGAEISPNLLISFYEGYSLGYTERFIKKYGEKKPND